MNRTQDAGLTSCEATNFAAFSQACSMSLIRKASLVESTRPVILRDRVRPFNCPSMSLPERKAVLWGSFAERAARNAQAAAFVFLRRDSICRALGLASSIDRENA